MNSGLLSFTGIGAGAKHSIETVKNNVVTADVTRNIVTVATASTHGLTIGNEVKMSVFPGITPRLQLSITITIEGLFSILLDLLLLE